MLVNDSQVEKTRSPMLITLAGIVIVVNFLQYPKAESPIVVNFGFAPSNTILSALLHA